jgi:hypothetical protein
MTADARDGPVNPNAMSVDLTAKLLAKASPGVTDDMLKADLAAGAPTNPDGTINLVHYAVWLVREEGSLTPTRAASSSSICSGS